MKSHLVGTHQMGCASTGLRYPALPDVLAKSCPGHSPFALRARMWEGCDLNWSSCKSQNTNPDYMTNQLFTKGNLLYNELLFIELSKYPIWCAGGHQNRFLKIAHSK